MNDDVRLNPPPRILLIPLYFAPLGSPRGIRWTNVAHYLARKGGKITVIAADAPEKSQFYDSSLQKIVEATGEGLDIRRVSIGPQNSSGKVRLSWMWKARKVLGTLDGSFDVVISSAMPIVCHFLGRQAKASGLAQYWIADYGDPWSTSHLRHNSAWRAQVEQFVERRLLSTADALTLTTLQAIESFTPVYPYEDRIHLIPQGASMFHREHDWDGAARPPGQEIRLFFTGELSALRIDPAALFEALAQYGDSATLTLIGPQPIDWKQRAREFGIDDRIIIRAEYFPQTEIVRLQSDADVLVDIANIVPQHIGGKFFEYLATNKPILYITHDANDEKSRFIREHEAGFVCTTAEEIGAAIQQVRGQLEQTGRVQRNPVSSVGFDERADRFWNLIHALRASGKISGSAVAQ